MTTPSNFNPASTTPTDPWSMHITQTYGGRSFADVQKYWDMKGARTTMGGASSAPSNWYGHLGSGSVRIQGMGGGGTPSDPGGYNYDTLDRMFSTPKDMVRSHQKRLDLARQRNVTAQVGKFLSNQGTPASGQPNAQNMVNQEMDEGPAKTPWIFRTRTGQRAMNKVAEVGERVTGKIFNAIDRRFNRPQQDTTDTFDLNDPF